MGPALLALWAALLPLREPGPLSPRIASYRIKVKLDASAHTLDGEETLLWRNDAGAPTRELWFHLYMNAFKNQTTAMLSPLGQGPGSSGLPSEKWGAVDVGSLRCDGHLLALELREDGTVGRVALPREVAPGQIVRCEIAWHTQLPQLVARAGFQGDFHMVAQWFPKIGVWDGRAWKCHVYCATCEFFADFGVYDVEITVPEKFVVGASGVLVSQSASAQTRTYVYHAEDVHDFAWAASPDFRERTKSFDAAPGLPPVTVRLLYQPDHAWFADEHLRLLGATLRDYGDWFGRYPYTTLTAIDPPNDATEAAMEYPTLVVTLTPASRLAPAGYARYVTIHELGHNWFYGLLASNEAEEPWLDEGLNEYASDRVLERATSGSMLGALLPDQAVLERLVWLGWGQGWDPLGLPAWAYPSRRAYEAAVYSQTSTLLSSLERHHGNARLLGALGLYARRYRFRHPTAAGLIAALSEGLGEDVAPLIGQIMAGAVWDYEVARVSARRADRTWQNSVLVHRKGTLLYPVLVRVRFEGGAEVLERWDGAARWTNLFYERRERVESATVDPAGAWLLDADVLNNGRRLQPAGLPGRRMASGLAFWLQSLWQAIGF